MNIFLIESFDNFLFQSKMDFNHLTIFFWIENRRFSHHILCPTRPIKERYLWYPLFHSASIGVDIFYCKCRCFKLGTHQSFSVISQLRLHNVQRLDNDDMILWRVDNGYNGHSMIDSIIVHNSYCQWSHKLHKYTISMVKSMFHKLSGNQLMENITQ